MAKYRKKPVVIEAVQWFKHGDHPDVLQYGESITDQYPIYSECGMIKTLEDEGGYYHHVAPGNWIITGVNGEHYACQPDIFERTYDAA